MLEPLRQALDIFFDTVAAAFVCRASDPLPPPALGPLRQAGIPTVGEDEFAAALAGETDRRCLLAALLADDGWTADQWDRRRRGMAPQSNR